MKKSSFGFVELVSLSVELTVSGHGLTIYIFVSISMGQRLTVAVLRMCTIVYSHARILWQALKSTVRFAKCLMKLWHSLRMTYRPVIA
jgi:hypothetical protein